MNYFEEIKINNFLKTIENIEGHSDIKLKKIFNHIDKQKLEKIFLNKKLTINLFNALFNNINTESMWTGRSLFFISALINDLHKSKEIYSFTINPYLILYYCNLKNIIDLNIDFKQKNINIKNIDNYLYHLPNSILNLNNHNEIPSIMMEQHGYIIMSIAGILLEIIEFYNYKENEINYRIETWNLIKNLENF